MAIIKNWSIEGVDVLTNLFQLQNVIRLVKWKLTVQNDGENQTLPQIVHIRGEVNLSLPNLNSFVPFENITEAQMLEWVKIELGEKVKEFEKNAEYHVINILMGAAPETMIIESRPLPWN